MCIMHCCIFLIFQALCFFHIIHFTAGILVCVGITLLIGLVIPYQELGVYLFICLAYFNVINLKLHTTSLFYLLCGIFLVRYLIQENKKYKISYKIILICTVFLTTVYNITDTSRYISWFILLLTCILLYKERIIVKKFKRILDLYTFSTITSSWWGYIMIQNGIAISNDADKFLDGMYSYYRFAGLVGDSVMFGSLILILISLNLVPIIANNKVNFKKLFFITNLIFLGFLTYSKTFYGGLIIELVVFLWFKLKQNKRNIKSNIIVLFSVFFAIIGLILWISMGTDTIATNMRQRLVVSDLTTGRFTAWAYYINLWKNDWTIIFKGIGFAEYATRRTFDGYTHSVMYAHNIIIELVTAFGFIETILILICGCIQLRRFLLQREKLYWLLPAFVFFVIFGMISHGNFESTYYFSALLVITIPQFEVRNMLICAKGEFINEYK